MSTTAYVETARPVESIVVGHRHRTDLGDLESLQRSIQRVGLLQPITVTPEGVLLCGLRRLEAVKRLGWRTVRCWVRSGLSHELGRLLAEQEENTERKPLAPLEAVELYRELKTVLADDAARRKQLTAFTGTEKPGVNGTDSDLSVNQPEHGWVAAAPPHDLRGRTRERAAQLVTGSASYTRMEQLIALQRWATDPRQPPAVRSMATAELKQIRDGAPSRPAYERVRRAIATARAHEADARGAGQSQPEPELERLAAEAVQRVTAENRAGRRSKTPPKGPRRRTRQWFALTWAELDGWTALVDVDELAVTLSDKELDTFERVLAETNEFAKRLRSARPRSRGAVA